MKIIALTYNELIKQFKAKGTKLILALLIISAILLPMGFKIAPQVVVNDSIKNNIEFNLNEYKTSIPTLEKNETNSGKIELAIAKAYQAGYQLEYEAKISFHEEIGYDDWRVQLVQEYRHLMFDSEAIKLLMEGVPSDVILDEMYNITPELIQDAQNMSTSDQQNLLAHLVTEQDKLKTMIINQDFMVYLSKMIETNNGYIKNIEKEITGVKNELSKDTDNQDLKNQLEILENDLTIKKEVLNLVQYRYDHKIDFSIENWKNNTLNTIEKTLSEKNKAMLSEEQFYREAALTNNSSSYEQYKVQYKMNQIEVKETIDKNWYSLEKNLPQLENTKDARGTILTLTDVYILCTTVFIIIIGGGIVANEFSTGSIRLLLIRPVKRTKILISKVLSLVVFGYLIIMITTVLTTISSGVVYGFESLMIPVVQMSNNAIVEQSFMLYLLAQLAISSISFVFIVALVFSLSTLSKNTAVAVAISLVLYLGSLPLTTLLSSKVSVIGNTFIPYINQSLLNLSPGTVEALKTQGGISFNPLMGLIQLGILSIILVGTAMVVFSKKDVQN